jgi:hypothetical protein
MDRPLINMADDANIGTKDIEFITKEIHVSTHHTEGYFLIFRKQIWMLDQDFVFKVKGYRIIARQGTLTDFASTPKVIWPIYPPTDSKYNKSVLAHDVLYAAEIFPRWVNDMVLDLGMLKEGSSKFTRFNFYTAVKALGWSVYARNTEDSVRKARICVDVYKD